MLTSRGRHSKVQGRTHGRTRLVVDIFAAVVCIAAVIFFVHVEVPVAITADQFPDEALRNEILQNVDVNHDGKLSNEEANEVTSLIVSDATTVSGLDVFPALKTLVVRGSSVTSVDVSNMQGLRTLDVAGAKNLTSLTVENVLNLTTLDLRGTSVKTLDLSKAGHLDKVVSDPTTRITGLDAGATEQLLLTHFEQTAAEDPAKNFTVDAQYEDDGTIAQKSVTGAANVTLSYEYDPNGMLSAVKVVDDGGTGLGNDWTISASSGAIDATGNSGTYVRRGYDAMGRLTSVDLNTVGVSGPLVCTMSLGYDARGYLNGIAVQSGDAKTNYVVECNGAARIEMVSTDAMTQYWNSNSDIVSGTLATDTSSVHSTNGGGKFSANVTRQEDGSVSRVVGKYKQIDASDEETRHVWGRQTAFDGSHAVKYDGDYQAYNVAADDKRGVTDAVLMRDKTDPSYVTDYWLLDDLESAVRVVALEAESTQWSMGSTDPIVDEVDTEEFEDELNEYRDALPSVADELGIGDDELAYAVFTSGEETLPMMAVSSKSAPDTIVAVYAIENGEPALEMRAEDGQQLNVCGGGFFRISGSDGSEQVFHFNGPSMDEVASVKNGLYNNVNLGIESQPASDADAESLRACYPSAGGCLEWEQANQADDGSNQ